MKRLIGLIAASALALIGVIGTAPSVLADPIGDCHVVYAPHPDGGERIEAEVCT